MCLCMYVCRHVFMYVCRHVFVYLCIHVCMRACIYVCIYYACIGVRPYVSMYLCIYVFMYVCRHVFMYVCMYMGVRPYVSMYLCIYYIFMYVCIIRLWDERSHESSVLTACFMGTLCKLLTCETSRTLSSFVTVCEAYKGKLSDDAIYKRKYCICWFSLSTGIC